MKSKKQSYDRVAKFFDFLRQGDMRRWNADQKSLFEKTRFEKLIFENQIFFKNLCFK